MLLHILQASRRADIFHLSNALDIADPYTISPDGIERQRRPGLDNEDQHGIAVIDLRAFNYTDAGYLGKLKCLLAIGKAKHSHAAANALRPEIEHRKNYAWQQ